MKGVPFINSVRFLTTAALTLGCAPIAQAATYTTATGSTGWQSFGFGPITLNLEQFDSTLGTLTGVTLHLTATAQAGVTIENGALDPANAITINLAGVVEAIGPNGDLDALSNIAHQWGPYSLAASDDPQGPPILYDRDGADYLNLGTLSNSRDSSSSSATNLSQYIGNGTVPVDVTGTGGWSAAGTTAYSLDINQFQGRGDAYLVYTYTPIPEPTGSWLCVLGALVLFGRRR